MCEKIRKRRIKRNITASAIFFRSKMSHPLSPKTPAILFDAISRKEAHHTERALHISIYDMTHRYDYNSNWIERVSNIFSREQTNHIPVDDASEESITNVSLTVRMFPTYKTADLLMYTRTFSSSYLCVYRIATLTIGPQ